MSNTYKQASEIEPGLDRRLDELARTAPAAAARLRQACPDAAAGCTDAWAALEPSAADAARRVEDWLRGACESRVPDIVMALGAGDWEAIRALLRLLPAASRVLVLEHDVARAARLFRNRPIEEDFRDGRLGLVLGDDPREVVAQYQSVLRMPTAPETRIFEAAVSGAEAAAFYRTALQDVCRRMQLNLFNLGTLVFLGPLWQFNTLKNLPTLAVNPGVDTLVHAFPGIPAVVVGAGPSLDAALPALRRLACRFVVLCAGTALKPVRRIGLRPDLVVSVDASPKTGPQFDTRCDDLYLASSSLAFPPVLAKFKGLFSGYHSANPIGRWLSSLGTPKGQIAACGTVTASAMDLAVKMGCNPVITIGLDLSFTDDGTTHASGTVYEGRRLPPATLRRVPGNYRDEVLTTEQFACYVRLIEEYIAHRPETTFINVTDRGARIGGMRLEPVEALERLAAAEPLDARDRIARIHAAYDEDIRPRVGAEIEALIRQLDEQIQGSRAAAMTCNQLIMILKAPSAGDAPRARELLASLDEASRRIAEVGHSSCILDMSLRPATFKACAKRQEHERNLSDGALAYRRLREMYEQIAGAAKWTRDLLEEARGHLAPRDKGEMQRQQTAA